MDEPKKSPIIEEPKTSPVIQDADVGPDKTPKNEVVSSPVIEKPKVATMSFGEIIPEVLLGKRITRLEWDNKEEYGFMRNTILSLHKSNEEGIPPKNWAINDGDLAAKDWISF